MAYGASMRLIRQQLAYREKRGEKIAASLQVEGMDDALLEKLTVLSGSLDPLRDPKGNAIAVAVDTDDYGNPQNAKGIPQPGEKLTVSYVDEGYYVDSRSGGEDHGGYAGRVYSIPYRKKP